MLTVRLTFIGFVALLFVLVLIVISMAYWHSVTGTNIMPLLAPGIGASC